MYIIRLISLCITWEFIVRWNFVYTLAITPIVSNNFTMVTKINEFLVNRLDNFCPWSNNHDLWRSCLQPSLHQGELSALLPSCCISLNFFFFLQVLCSSYCFSLIKRWFFRSVPSWRTFPDFHSLLFPLWIFCFLLWMLKKDFDYLFYSTKSRSIQFFYIFSL